MDIDGIWTGEIGSAYGWENSGVYVLEHNRIRGGNNRHYSDGTYQVSGKEYKAEINVHYYGPARSIFGDQSQDFKIFVSGKINNDLIEASITRSDRPGLEVPYRMTKRLSLEGEAMR